MFSPLTAYFVNLQDLDDFIKPTGCGWNKKKRQEIGVLFQAKSVFMVHCFDGKTDFKMPVHYVSIT